MVVSIDFCKLAWSGTCWRTGLLLNIKYQTLNLVSVPQGTPTNSSLFFATFSRLLKRKNEGIHCFPGPLCCLRQCSKREALISLDTCKKLDSAVFERHRSNHVHRMHVYTFSLMATKFLRRLRPTKAWNRAALWVPFCTPFITIMTWTDSWLYREVLPLPWIQLKSLTAVIMLMTLLSLQTRL